MNNNMAYDAGIKLGRDAHDTNAAVYASIAGIVKGITNDDFAVQKAHTDLKFGYQAGLKAFLLMQGQDGKFDAVVDTLTNENYWQAYLTGLRGESEIFKLGNFYQPQTTEEKRTMEAENLGITVSMMQDLRAQGETFYPQIPMAVGRRENIIPSIFSMFDYSINPNLNELPDIPSLDRNNPPLPPREFNLEPVYDPVDVDPSGIKLLDFKEPDFDSIYRILGNVVDANSLKINEIPTENPLKTYRNKLKPDPDEE